MIGMQFPVSDTVALLFARTLYTSLADGAPIAEAVFEGRTAIGRSTQGWGAPVLISSLPTPFGFFSIQRKDPEQRQLAKAGNFICWKERRDFAMLALVSRRKMHSFTRQRLVEFQPRPLPFD